MVLTCKEKKITPGTCARATLAAHVVAPGVPIRPLGRDRGVEPGTADRASHTTPKRFASMCAAAATWPFWQTFSFPPMADAAQPSG
jgi:hypothetical protein